MSPKVCKSCGGFIGVDVVEVNDIVASSDIAKLLNVKPATLSTWRSRDTHEFHSRSPSSPMTALRCGVRARCCTGGSPRARVSSRDHESKIFSAHVQADREQTRRSGD